ncbi:MAG: DUF4136 domain-containing protein [Hyalangium sp.]|uniref:DUF4136 domain-containing protein n=1 Tax=Hyalangium sp. TaxID=2028555 RepID=UPI00389AA6C6
MSHPLRSLLLFLTLALVACAGIETNTNYDPSAVGKLSQYRTYSWLARPQGKDTRVYNDVVEANVKQAVDRELQSRGYRLVDQNPDFRLGWQGAIDRKLDIQTVDTYYGYGWGPGYAPYYAGAAAPSTYVRQYDQGTLIIDVVDAASNKLVWRGTAQAELSNDSTAPEKQKRLGEAINKILEDFPPKPGE